VSLRIAAESLLLVTVAVALPSQDTAAVAAGDAVKVTAPSRQLHEWPGVFVRVQGDSAVFRGVGKDSSLTALSLRSITRLEVNHGNQPSHGHALIGLAIGAGVGIAAGFASASCQSDCIGPGQGAMALAYGGIGAALGAGIGALIHTDPYKTVDLKPQAGVASLPGGRSGIYIGLRLRF
jgi:hypothetical protein